MRLNQEGQATHCLARQPSQETTVIDEWAAPVDCTRRYATFASLLGRVLLAATECGICKTSLGANAAQLDSGLRAEFSVAVIKRDDRRTSRMIISWAGWVATGTTAAACR